MTQEEAAYDYAFRYHEINQNITRPDSDMDCIQRSFLAGAAYAQSSQQQGDGWQPMKALQIDETNARKLYATASPEFKAALEDTFTKSFFAQKITDRVKTFEDACKIDGCLSTAIDFNCGTPDDIAYQKLKVINRVLNEGWTPDWDNVNQHKHYPYFKITGSGVSYVDHFYWSTSTYVGSRLCFKSSELALYAGKQFLSIYNDYLTV